MAASWFVSLASMYMISTTNAEILRLQCKYFANFSIIKHHAVLQGSVIATFLFKSERECRFDCMMNSQCKSFNRENQGDQRCELNSRTTENVTTLAWIPGWTLHSTDYNYPFIGRTCQKDHCPKGVLCKDTCTCNGYTCFPCPNNRAGLRCSGWKDCQGSTTGIEEYRFIQPEPTIMENVLCSTGWILIQKRDGFHSDFNRRWKEYVKGFGNLGDRIYWMGLEKMHRLTSARKQTELRIELSAGSEAYYKKFSIGSEREGYSLHVSGFNANSSTLPDMLSFHNQMKFSTADHNYNATDQSYCAEQRFQAGWWYTDGSGGDCYMAQLNAALGPIWNQLGHYSSSMMIRYREEEG